MSYKRKRHIKTSVVIAAVVICAAAAIAAVGIKKARPVENTVSSSAAPFSKISSSENISSQVSSDTESSSDSILNYTGKTTDKIPILMYHSINYEKNNILRVPKDKFAAEMKWLNNNGYRTLSLDELYNAVSNNIQVPEKSVVLTFDDGYKDNYESAFPVIKKYKFKATVFMITNEINDSKNGYLTEEQIKEMDKNGMKVECHTLSHPDLNDLTYAQQLKELRDSKTKLEGILGHSVDFLAYPSGKYNDDTIKAAKEAGYKMCFKMKGGIGSLSDNSYKFPRFFVGEDLDDFRSRVKGTADYS